MEELNLTDLDLEQFERRGVGDFTMALWHSFYTVATDEQPVNPLTAAPRFEPNGGFIFFGDEVEKEDFFGFCRMVGVRDWMTHYVAAVVRAERPRDQGYLVQMRISSGLVPPPNLDVGSKQKLTVSQALFAFIEDQRKEWGHGYGPRLSGIFGGDGDFAKERLSFGFMIENDYHGTYRIWSRAWLVTK